MQKTLYLLLLIFSSVFYLSCKSDYEKMVDRELAKGTRQDSLFLGMFLGMARDSFYSHCRQANAKGVLTHGSTNNMALHILPETSPIIFLNFYPKFSNNKIILMDAYFSYETWAPWKKETHSEALLPVVLNLLNKWYGCDFLEVAKNKTHVWVSLHSNRRIRVFIHDNQYVRLEIKDLTAPESDATY